MHHQKDFDILSSNLTMWSDIHTMWHSKMLVWLSLFTGLALTTVDLVEHNKDCSECHGKVIFVGYIVMTCKKWVACNVMSKSRVSSFFIFQTLTMTFQKRGDGMFDAPGSVCMLNDWNLKKRLQFAITLHATFFS